MQSSEEIQAPAAFTWFILWSKEGLRAILHSKIEQ
jgi:hypothetical protein